MLNGSQGRLTILSSREEKKLKITFLHKFLIIAQVKFYFEYLQLLEKDRSKRLGSGNGDFDDIQQHSFFRHINWDHLIAKKIKPPFNPLVKGTDYIIFQTKKYLNSKFFFLHNINITLLFLLSWWKKFSL